MPNLLLTGFSGTGKTAIGRLVAALLAWDFIDTDSEVRKRVSKSIDAIFSEDGEAAFRRLEAEALAKACAGSERVIATGGGAFAQEANRELMLRSGVVVCLEASPDVIYRRLLAASGDAPSPETRPLLTGGDELGRIRQLKAQRQPIYSLAHWTVHTDYRTPEEVAAEVVRAWDTLRSKLPQEPSVRDSALAAVLHSSSGPCPIYVEGGLLDRLGEQCHKAGLATTAYVFSDNKVFSRHGRRAVMALEHAGIPTHAFVMSAGETSKSLETVAQAYQWLAGQRAERGHFIVAVGGGVVGDVAGYVAATFNRGMPLVQVPTSLAAMVDASIGGKTAVNLPAGKNLVGAFHQPRLVLADVRTLVTLPERELRSGWAEAIKHGLILDAQLANTFDGDHEAIRTLTEPVAVEVIKRSMAIKADIVTRDETETLGIRTLLNYGHTVGHALEAETGYDRLLHGEAIAIGMAAAGRISNLMGLLKADGLEYQNRLLQRYGLPTRCPGVDLDGVRKAMAVDKKTSGGTISWVLLEKIGKATLHSDVPASLVDQALREMA